VLQELGRVASESRSPVPSRGPQGRRKHPARQVDDAAPGHAEVWYQVTGVQGDRVRFEVHYLFAAPGEEPVTRTSCGSLPTPN